MVIPSLRTYAVYGGNGVDVRGNEDPFLWIASNPFYSKRLKHNLKTSFTIYYISQIEKTGENQKDIIWSKDFIVCNTERF